MKNPARELAFLLQNWRKLPAGQTIFSIRELNEQYVEQWRMQIKAVELLSEVDRALEALSEAGEDVEHYRDYLVAWQRAVFAPDQRWGEGYSSTVELYEAHVVAMLKATADMLDRKTAPVEVSPERKIDSIAALDEVVEMLKSMDLPDAVRRYVFELVNSCRTVLQEADALDSVDLFARVHELAGVLSVLMESLRSDPEDATWLQGILRRLVPYSAPVRAAGMALQAAADFKEITGG